MAGRKARRGGGRTSGRRIATPGAVKAFDSVNAIPNEAWMASRYAEGYRLYVLHSTEWPPSTAPWYLTQTQLGWAVAEGLKIAAYVRNPNNWAAGIDACGPYAPQLQFFAIDIETDPGIAATRAMVDGIKARGVRPVIYSGSGMWPSIMGGAANDFPDVPLWDTDANPAVDPATWTANLNSPTPVTYGGWNTAGNPRIMVQQKFEATVGGVLVDLNSVQNSFLRDL